MNTARHTFLHSMLVHNPAWAQLLGLCPLLAVSSTVANAAGLAAASTFVLIGSSLVVGVLRAWIPQDVRLPCFVLVIASFTTLTMLLMQAFAFDLYERIALFVQIIVTNCMILARIELIASREPLRTTLVDALGTSLGFALALLALGAVRELLTPLIPLAALPPGAFIIAGLLLALTRVRQGAPNQNPSADTQAKT